MSDGNCRLRIGQRSFLGILSRQVVGAVHCACASAAREGRGTRESAERAVVCVRSQPSGSLRYIPDLRFPVPQLQVDDEAPAASDASRGQGVRVCPPHLRRQARSQQDTRDLRPCTQDAAGRHVARGISRRSTYVYGSYGRVQAWSFHAGR